MERTNHVVLLSLWLCLVFCYVHAAPPVRVLGGSFHNMHKDLSRNLDTLKKQRNDLEAEVKNSKGVDKWYNEMKLQDVVATLKQFEANSRVPYNDYVASLSGQRKAFEEETAKLRAQLADAENKRLQSEEALKYQQLNKGVQVATYMTALTKATTERNKIANQYAKFMDEYSKQEEKMKKQKLQFLTENGKLQQTLDGAKTKHSQVFDAMSATPTAGFKSITIPEQIEINKLRESIASFNGMADRKKLKEGLEITRTKLQELLDKLYKAGKFSSKTSRGDIESALGEIEKNVIDKRKEQEIRRKGLVNKFQKGNINNFDEEEIATLKKTHEEMAAADMLQQEVVRRSAYLKGIVEVSDLMKECSNAIRDANERNLANLWAEAIQGAADSPLGKFWAESLQDAKDGELAKAWADAIQGSKNSKLATAWTNAIEEAKDINLAEVWNDVVQNLKESPLSKLWIDTIKNAKESPFTKECANAVQGAKNSFCEVISKFNKNKNSYLTFT